MTGKGNKEAGERNGMPKVYLTILFFSVLSTLTSLPLNAGNIDPAPGLDRYRKVSQIIIKGNYQTHQSTILTELPFQIGNQIKGSDLNYLKDRATKNLLNTSLFNFVEISINLPTRSTVEFIINLEERWYIWLFPLLEHDGRNFSDFLRQNNADLISYGLYFRHDNFRGRRESFKLRVLTGHRTQALINFRKPSFNQQSGWGIKIGWVSYNQIAFNTIDDKQVFIKKQEKISEETSLEFSYFFRPQLYHHHELTTSYINLNVADTLIKSNPDFLPTEGSSNQSLDIKYQYTFDNRDSKAYPLQGTHFSFSFARRGYSIDNEYDGFFHSMVNLSYQTPLIYRTFARSIINISAIEKEQVPYMFRTGLGYNNHLNGFEYRVIDGTSYAIQQNKIMYQLLPKKEHNIRWIPWPQFSRIHYSLFLKLHFDAGYVYHSQPLPQNNMANSLLFGYGFGIDAVTFYDKVLSLNYSFNNFGEQGLFVHLNLSL